MVVCFEKMAHFIYVVKINLWNYSYHPMIILLMCLMCLKGLYDIACVIPNICNLCLLSFILVLLLEFQFYYFIIFIHFHRNHPANGSRKSYINFFRAVKFCLSVIIFYHIPKDLSSILLHFSL